MKRNGAILFAISIILNLILGNYLYMLQKRNNCCYPFPITLFQNINFLL